MTVPFIVWFPYVVGLALGAWAHAHYIKRRDEEEGRDQ